MLERSSSSTGSTRVELWWRYLLETPQISVKTLNATMEIQGHKMAFLTAKFRIPNMW